MFIDTRLLTLKLRRSAMYITSLFRSYGARIVFVIAVAMNILLLRS